MTTDRPTGRQDEAAHDAIHDAIHDAAPGTTPDAAHETASDTTNDNAQDFSRGKAGNVAGIEVDYSDIKPGVSAGEQATGSKRLLQISLGVLLVVVGIPMIPLVGPGWALVLVGLNLIKPDNAVVRWLRRKLPVVPNEGPVPKRYYVIGAVLLILSSALSWLYRVEVASWIRDVLGV